METDLITAYVALLTITNPIGNIPIFLSLTEEETPLERRGVATFAALAVFVILAVSMLAGKQILALFGINPDAFHIAGDCVIIAIAWGMLMASKKKEHAKEDNVAVVPLAIPVLAGPGAIGIVIESAPELGQTGQMIEHLVVIALVAVSILLVLYAAPSIARVLRTNGTEVLTRIFGLILLSIAVSGLVREIGIVFPALLRV